MPGYIFIFVGILLCAGLYILLKPAANYIYENCRLEGFGKVLLVCLLVAVIFYFGSDYVN